jgi:hypothetical protein
MGTLAFGLGPRADIISAPSAQTRLLRTPAVALMAASRPSAGVMLARKTANRRRVSPTAVHASQGFQAATICPLQAPYTGDVTLMVALTAATPTRWYWRSAGRAPAPEAADRIGGLRVSPRPITGMRRRGPTVWPCAARPRATAPQPVSSSPTAAKRRLQLQKLPKQGSHEAWRRASPPALEDIASGWPAAPSEPVYHAVNRRRA